MAEPCTLAAGVSQHSLGTRRVEFIAIQALPRLSPGKRERRSAKNSTSDESAGRENFVNKDGGRRDSAVLS
jgi:hypothetical protein